MKAALILLLVPFAGGCVRHAVRAEAPAARLCADGNGAAASPAARTGGLPLELRATAWRREADGAIARDDAVLRSPLPWWQRFPADLGSDLLWPWTPTCPAEAVLQATPIPACDEAALVFRARSLGYAGRAGEQPPAGEAR